MKLIDIYKIFKRDYQQYVVLIKSGVFYYVYDKDTCIINSLFKWKL